MGFYNLFQHALSVHGLTACFQQRSRSLNGGSGNGRTEIPEQHMDGGPQCLEVTVCKNIALTDVTVLFSGPETASAGDPSGRTIEKTGKRYEND